MEKRTKTEYTVIRWYNDCEALVLFTGWEPFMHTDAERKYAAKAARVRRASRGRWLFPTRLRSPMQRKYAAQAAHGARGE